jgi:hypothetical protein
MAGNVAPANSPVNWRLPEVLHRLGDIGYHYFGSPCSTCNRGR